MVPNELLEDDIAGWEHKQAFHNLPKQLFYM